MKTAIALLLAVAATAATSATRDSDAPLPTTARELRAERLELQRRLAMVEQRLTAIGGQSTPARPPASAATLAAPAAPAASSRSLPSGCYVGPRGGTYTITKSRKKNYGGC